MKSQKVKILIFSLFILNSLGCATSAMRNGVAQARYEIQKASPALQCGDDEAPRVSVGRLDRADAVLGAWQKAYGCETRSIDDNSYNSVLEQMRSESTLKNIVSTAAGSWSGILFGTSGAGTILVSILLKYLQERGRRKEMETAAGDCAAAIESIRDETARTEAKETVRKRQSSRTKFHKLVQQTPQAG
jgi:hypothetical protein